MKPFSILTWALLFSTLAYAQEKPFKPVRGTVTADVGLAGGLLNTAVGLNNNATGISSGVLRFRYFDSPKLAFRIGAAVVNNRNEETQVLSPTATSNTIVKNSAIEFNLGVEKHFSGSNRLSTFVGADLLFGITGAGRNIENSNGDYSNLKNSNGGALRGSSNIGLRLITGADFYFARKLYLGTEVGLTFLSGKTKAVTRSVKNGNVVTETRLTEPGSTFTINPGVVTGIRLGFQF